MKQKLALYQQMDLHYSEPTACPELFDQIPSYVRLTEFVEVDFPDLHSDEVVSKQLASIDAAELKLREAFEGQLNNIQDMRSKLLALTVKA